MKTLGISRTIRRRLPGGWFVSIGPSGLAFRQRRQKVLFFISWREAGHRAQFLYPQGPPEGLLSEKEASSLLPDSRQIPMFGFSPDHHDAAKN